MAFNAFRNVLIDAATNELLVKGVSQPPLGSDATFVVAVASAESPTTRRAQGADTDNPGSSEWVTRVPQPVDGEPFKEGDEVFISGVAMVDGEAVFVWADLKPIDLKPV